MSGHSHDGLKYYIFSPMIIINHSSNQAGRPDMRPENSGRKKERERVREIESGFRIRFLFWTGSGPRH